jgi:protein SCO1/2
MSDPLMTRSRAQFARHSLVAIAIGSVHVLAIAAWRIEAVENSPSESRLAVIRPAPDFKLTDQSGKELRMPELKGKVVLVSFIFTTCNGTCPATTHRMSLVQRELTSRGLFKNSQVHLLSITLDPVRDTPDVLRGYMQLYDAAPDHWSFLSGPKGDVEKAIEAWGMWARPAPNGQLDHPSRIFLVDAQGRIREIYNLGFMNPDLVTDDVKLLLDESLNRGPVR